MSEMRQIAGHLVADRESSFADQVTDGTSGVKFLAEIQEIEDTSLNTELGIDARATNIFNIRDKTVPLRAGTIWLALNSRYLVLPRNAPDNPATPQLKVFCMVLTDQDT